MKSSKKNGSFSAKGYYIALILCAAAIGISGYLYYRNANQDDTQLQDPTSDVGAAATDDLNVNADTDVHASSPADDTQVDATTDDPIQVDGTQATQKQAIQTCSPLSGETIGYYAMECLAYNPTTRDWRVHDGIDIAAEAGATVCAVADGTVYTAYEDETMGMTVVIRHEDGYITTYSSLDADIPVSAGDTVTMGQAIGSVGNTALLETSIGDHLHFSVTCDGESVDPEEFLDLT